MRRLLFKLSSPTVRCGAILLMALSTQLYAEQSVITPVLLKSTRIETVQTNDPARPGGYLLSATIPISSIERDYFALEFELEFKTFNHYAELSVGVQNSTNGYEASFLFSMGDDWKHMARFSAELRPGYKVSVDPFELVDIDQEYRCRLEYKKPNSSFKWTIENSEDQLVYESEWKKLRGVFNVDQFFIQVTGQTEGSPSSSLTYNKSSKTLKAKSNVGDSYQIKAEVYNVHIIGGDG